MAKPKTPRKKYDPLPLSEAALARIERVARQQHGAAFSRDELAAAVASISRVYTRNREGMADLPAQRSAALARIAFFLARDLPKVFGPLDDLRATGWQPPGALRVLDVGAGFGAMSLGLARWLRLRDQPVTSLEVVALEHDGAALRGFAELAKSLADLPTEIAPITLRTQAADLRGARTAGRFDLVLYGFVLNELFLDLGPDERAARRAEVLTEASAQLAEGGAVIVLEPALKETARELMHVRDVLAARASAPYVVAPCLHTGACPMRPSERDWCHQERAYALPPALAEVARGAQLRYEGLSYASLVLRNTPPAPTSERRVRIVSDRLETKGKLELFGCSEAGYTRLTQLTRDERDDNHAFTAAVRGDVLAIESDDARIGPTTRVTKR